jgi:RecA-family ATPase
VHNLDALYPVVKYDPLMKAKRVDWLIDGLWQLGKINAVAGAEKSGKSRLIGWFLVGMARGSVLGLNATLLMPPKILYLCGEETVATVNQRITKYAELQGVPANQFDIHFIEAAAMRLDLKTQREWLREKMLDEDFSMLVADPLRRLHGADENDSTQMSVIYNDIRKWSNRDGLSIVLVHHTPKIGEDTDMTRIASWFRGSTDTAAILDTAQYVDRIGKDGIQMLRAGRFPPLPPLAIHDLGDERGFTRSFGK